MPDSTLRMAALATLLTQRRGAILRAWRGQVDVDPLLTTGAALPRAQLHDHIPALLEDFEQRLAAADSPAGRVAESDQQRDAAAHGLHRWQQGFDLNEVTRELGRLNECVVAELERAAELRHGFDAATMAEARRLWAGFYGIALGSSTSQYFELRRIEAAGHVADLEQALAALRELEAQQAALWREAAHDLKGNLGVVSITAAALASDRFSEDNRSRFLHSLDRNVRALHALLEDVTGLARLQGGHEVRQVEPMDAARVLHDLAESLRPMADERRLRLSFIGPAPWPVEGDAVKTRRIVQNLTLNAIRYTRQGGVTVTWGPIGEHDPQRWAIEVADTGPGLQAGPSNPMADALGLATRVAAGVTDGDGSGESRPAAAAATDSPPPGAPGTAPLRPGEGIGLSIVKRLCTLLDATLEVTSVAGSGTTFRILLPIAYGA